MDELKHLPLSEVSNTLPNQYEDWKVRIYCRGSKDEFDALMKVFTLWREEHIQEETSSTPSLKRRRTITFPARCSCRFSDTGLEEHSLTES